VLQTGTAVKRKVADEASYLRYPKKNYVRETRR